MTEKQKIYKPKPISGFPEWLPEERLVEQRWFDHIRKTFESYGFTSIETPSVEEIDVLLAKGEVDKEIYEIKRIHAEEGEKESRLALHFDQTVPFARYTAQHFNELTFPFKRYQMQRVWRGERPQMGRMREFYQCDIDVINVDNLPLSFDAEVAAVMYEVIAGLNIGKVQMRISNRKILKGVLQAGGIIDQELEVFIIRNLDKLDKTERVEIIDSIKNKLSESPSVEDDNKAFQAIYNFYEISNTRYPSGDAVLEAFQNHHNIDSSNELLLEGIKELTQVIDSLSHLPEGAVVADLSIVRGLDYYTGTVYETQLLDVPEFTGSVCSGGRYDDLAGGYINKHLPGVGISLGFSRLFDVIRQSRPDLLNIGAKCPTDILVYTEDETINANLTAQTLRKRGLNVEVFGTTKKWDKHFNYAKKKGIPNVWYITAQGHEIKNLATDSKQKADPESWVKDE